MSSSFRKPITVNRFAAGAYVNGVWTEAAPVAVVGVTASIQPAPGKEMESLDAGRRTKRGFILYTDTLLQSVETAKNPDQVVLADGSYEVVKVEPWQNQVLPHYRALIVRMSA